MELPKLYRYVCHAYWIFANFPTVMQFKIIVHVPYEGQGPRVKFRVQVTSSHGTYNITTSRSISSPVAPCIGH